MNEKIQLFFSTESVINCKSGIKLHQGIRLLTVVQFMTSQGWSNPESAIVNTGAPISLVPQKIWRRCVTKVIGETELRGVVSKKECVLVVKV